MALRLVARRVGVRALHRASPPPVSPLVTSRSYHCNCKAGYSNGGTAQKLKERFGSSLTEENNAWQNDAVARIKSSYQATIDSIERSKRMEKLHRRLDMASSVAGVGLGLYIFSCIPPEVMEEALRK